MTAPDESDLRRLLAVRADDVDPPAAPIDRLVAAGAQAQRRRRFGAVATGVGVAASVALLAGVLTGGPGGDVVPPADRPTFSRDASPVLFEDGEPMLVCGDSGAFAASAMTAGRGHPRASEIDSAVARASVGDRDWRVLQESGDRIDLAIGAWDNSGPRHGGLVVHLTSTTERLEVTGISDCDVRPALADPDAGWAGVELLEEPEPATESLTVSVRENFCAAGRDPGPHLQEPYIEETDTTVTVFWPSTRPSEVECDQSGTNPAVVRTITLAAPLGDRQVRDGSAWPARPLEAMSDNETVAEPPVQTDAEETLLRCGSMPPFVESAMSEPQRTHEHADDIEAALRRLVETGGIDAPTPLRDSSPGPFGWRVLSEDEDHLQLAVGDWGADGPGPNAWYVMLRPGSGLRWVGGGWGQCRDLEPVPTRGTWAEVRLAGRPDATQTTLQVAVTERGCASGRDPAPHLHEPTVVETAAAVTIYWTSRPQSGPATCQGNPSVERTVSLDAPLGDRSVLDGSAWPPKPVGP